MYVVKRDGTHQPVHFDKITSRIGKLSFGLSCDPVVVAQKVIQGVYAGVTTTQLDELAAETSAYMSAEHPDYAFLAGRLAASNIHKSTTKSFSQITEKLHAHSIVSDAYAEFVAANATKLDGVIVHDRDFDFDYFGIKTLTKSYLLKIENKIVERPQHMFMRTAVGIHMDVGAAIETYDMMSRRVFVHATPTLFNAGTVRPQMSSCFLMTVKSDSIDGIFETLSDCAKISKYAGGIGIAVHDIRAKGAPISKTNGVSNGLVPMLRVFDSTARYVDQGGGKRKGSFAIYLEPWHADIEDFLELKKNTGKDEMRARDLFYGLWIPDLFMKRVESKSKWTLFCPTVAPGLSDAYGDEFDALYEKYEREGHGTQIDAQELWFRILTAQIETGTPYLLFKDACNSKSNQKNLGTIRCSNLCTEIVEYTAPDEIAVCNLASISLKSFVRDGQFDFDALVNVARVVTRNLNKIIDGNYYPVPEAERSNKRHRPIGLGVQGLADCFMEMRLPFESDEARTLNARIFESIYFGAVTESVELAKVHGAYETFDGSPASKGFLQFDLWNVQPTLDWGPLKEVVKTHGMRNSLLVAPMPTASTSQILGNNECFEPFTSNIFSRRVLAGDFVVVNKYLVRDLISLNMWNHDTRAKLIDARGSVQGLDVPDSIKQIYKTVWEIKQRSLIEMAADRGAYIDQSQSLNLFLAEPTHAKLTSMHFFSWRKGLKTGCYYLRTQPKAQPISGLGADTPTTAPAAPQPKEDCLACSA